MRHYSIIFSVPDINLDPNQTTTDDLKALKNGELTHDDLMEAVIAGDFTVSYSVVDHESPQWGTCNCAEKSDSK